MRGLLGLLAVVVLVLIVGVATGFISIGQTQEARLPRVEAQGGQLPKLDVDVGKIDVRTKQTTVDVPVIEIDRARTAPAEPAEN
jgi:uncharacterized membrane protein